ncbi:MAG: hypothetical protein OXI91_06110 [Chloroflexota bacterium]|nr:hypothetical protein [Chloroflexota bacterium]
MVGELHTGSFFSQDEENVTDNKVVQLVPDMTGRLPGASHFQAVSGGHAAGDDPEPGAGPDIHTWEAEPRPDRTEGETLEIGDWQKWGAQAQETEPYVGPSPADRLPAGTWISGELRPGDTLTGEITTRGQFLPYKLVVEPGRKYRIDMRGADTGDGTLSDPWISGIKGAFDTVHGVQMQPVWYDEQGRFSTKITWPGGQDFVLDQLGRFFTISTGSNGETVHSPPMGANDDGGEGFNAQLFMVNFPAIEYLIAVSGAPNPTATGTFAISLTDVTEDDYSAGVNDAGMLFLDEPSCGALEAPGDEDWFAVTLDASVTYVVEARGCEGPDSLRHPHLAGIYDQEGALVDGTLAPADGSPRSQLSFTPAGSGVFYFAVVGTSPYMPNLSVLPVGKYGVRLSAES